MSSPYRCAGVITVRFIAVAMKPHGGKRPASIRPSLLARSGCNRAFSSPAWFIAAYQSQPETPLHVIVARRNGILAGVLPLVINTLVVNNKTRLAEFATVWNDYNDMITATGDTEVLSGLLHYALTQSTACDRLALQRLRYDSNCFRALRSFFSASRAYSAPRACR